MQKEDEDWLFESLKKLDEGISKIVNIQVEAGSRKGDNYNSNVYRIKLQVMNHSGVTKKSLILKCLPSHGTNNEFSPTNNSKFVKEVRVYREILAKMENIIQKSSTKTIFPTFVGARLESKILLEDLQESSYKICGNRIGLDLKHSALLLEALGKFHALGAILKENNELNVDDYCKYYYEVKKEFCVKLFRNNFNELAWIMENKWKGEWVDYARRLNQVASSLGMELMNVYKRSDERFNTLLHGDCCFLNVMFQHSENESPISVRFLDFQNCWVNSVGFDLNYFFWMSLHVDEWARKDELVRLYHESLCFHLRLYGYAKVPPSLQEIVADCKRTDIYGFVISIALLEFLMQPPDAIPDVEKLSFYMSSECESVTFITREHSETENYKRAVQCIVKRAASIGLI